MKKIKFVNVKAGDCLFFKNLQRKKRNWISNVKKVVRGRVVTLSVPLFIEEGEQTELHKFNIKEYDTDKDWLEMWQLNLLNKKEKERYMKEAILIGLKK